MRLWRNRCRNSNRRGSHSRRLGMRCSRDRRGNRRTRGRSRRSRSCTGRDRNRGSRIRRSSSASSRSAGRLCRLRSGRRWSARICWSRCSRIRSRISRSRTGSVPLLLYRGLRVLTHVIQFFYGWVDHRNHVDLRRVGGGVWNILGYRQLIFVASPAKIFVCDRRLWRGHQLGIQPAMHRLPSSRPCRPYAPVPRRLRSSHNRAAGYGQRRNDCSLAQAKWRTRRFLGFHALGDIGKQLRFFSLFLLLLVTLLLTLFLTAG